MNKVDQQEERETTPCPECGIPVDLELTRCPECGTDVTEK